MRKVREAKVEVFTMARTVIDYECKGVSLKNGDMCKALSSSLEVAGYTRTEILGIVGNVRNIFNCFFL